MKHLLLAALSLVLLPAQGPSYAFLAAAPLLRMSCSRQLPPRENAAAIRARLQGTWVLSVVEWMGETTMQTPDPWQRTVERALRQGREPAELWGTEPAEDQTTLTFAGDDYNWRYAGRVIGAGSYRLDEGRKPPVMEMIGFRVFYHGDPLYTVRTSNRGEALPALYALEGDRLRLCGEPGSTQPPARMEARTVGVFLLVFEKAKPKR